LNDRARQLRDLPGSICEARQELARTEAALEKKRADCATKKKSPAETITLTTRLMDRVDSAAAFVEGLEERLASLRNEADAAAAAGHPWPDVSDDPTVAASRDVTVETVKARQHHLKNTLLAAATTAVPEWVT
jgi:hypothetical protein